MQDEHAAFAADVVKRPVAGAVARWAMEKVTGSFWKHEDEEARNRYEEVTGGRYPPMRMAEKPDDLLRLRLSDEQRPYVAQGLRWAYGLGAGSAYACSGVGSLRQLAGKGSSSARYFRGSGTNSSLRSSVWPSRRVNTRSRGTRAGS